jgi:hypothetical protein
MPGKHPPPPIIKILSLCIWGCMIHCPSPLLCVAILDRFRTDSGPIPAAVGCGSRTAVDGFTHDTFFQTCGYPVCLCGRNFAPLRDPLAPTVCGDTCLETAAVVTVASMLSEGEKQRRKKKKKKKKKKRKKKKMCSQKPKIKKMRAKKKSNCASIRAVGPANVPRYHHADFDYICNTIPSPVTATSRLQRPICR